MRQLRERFLPAESAHFQRDHAGDSFLHDVDLGAADPGVQVKDITGEAVGR